MTTTSSIQATDLHECGHFVAGVNQRGRAYCCLCGMEYDCDTKKFHKHDPDNDWKDARPNRNRVTI